MDRKEDPPTADVRPDNIRSFIMKLREITPVIYDHLRTIARGRMNTGPSSPSLQPTALVNEALTKLLKTDPLVHDEDHLVSLVVQAMQQVWIDHARAKTATKRGGGSTPVDILMTDVAAPHWTSDRLLDLNWALEGIEESDPQLGLLLKLRLFTDLSMKEISVLVDLPLRTTERRWRYGAALLRHLIG
ncbi:MAG: ECF-type sigma factor [Phycisphaerales bacterium]|nr:ECF-type sigma factor [Phycisphaerales bacterium]